MAEIDPEFAGQAQAAAAALADQAKAILQSLGPEQAEEFRRQAEKLRESIRPEDFKIDQKQLDQLKQQMDQWKRQMEEMRDLQFGNRV